MPDVNEQELKALLADHLKRGFKKLLADCKREGVPYPKPVQDYLASLNVPPPGFDCIYRYTREQAIEDGVLVDLSKQTPDLVERAGLQYDVAITSAAFSEIGGWWDDGKLRDRLTELFALIQGLAMLTHPSDPNGDRLYFTFTAYRDGKEIKVPLWVSCSGGDFGEPVLTIMVQGED